MPVASSWWPERCGVSKRAIWGDVQPVMDGWDRWMGKTYVDVDLAGEDILIPNQSG
jgi:hypothetical protein